MVYFLERALTTAEMRMLKNRTLGGFVIQRLSMSSEYNIVKGRFERDIYTKPLNFKTNYILDGYSLHPVPSVMLVKFNWEIDRTLQGGLLKLPETIKVGDKILFV